MQLNGLSSRACFVLEENILCIQILIRYMYLAVDIFYQMYKLVLMYIFIWPELCYNFNVSSTKLTHMLNILDKFSMGEI